MKDNFTRFLDEQRLVFRDLTLRVALDAWKTKELKEQLGLSFPKDLGSSVEKGFAAPCRTLFEPPSKKLRPILGHLILMALGVKKTGRYLEYLVLPEILHTASLVIDDIEDGATLRRNRPCLHVSHGMDTAVNLANALYFLPFSYIRKGRLPARAEERLRELFIEALNRMHAGQGLDIAWHKNPDVAVTRSQYLLMARLKTSTFFRLEAAIACLLANRRRPSCVSILDFAEEIGIGFQIMDDVLDVTVTSAHASAFGKRFAQDITEGKKTLILTLALERASARDKRTLQELLAAHTTDPARLRAAVSLLNKYRAVADAEQYARRRVARAWEKISRDLVPSPAKEHLEKFGQFLVERKF